MNKFAVLEILLFHLLINTSSAKETENDVKMEEFEMPLKAKFVRNIVNPDSSLRPPQFSAAIYKGEKLAATGAILSKYYLITLCTVIKGGKDVTGSLKISFPVFDPLRMLSSIRNITATHVEVHPECGDKEINPAKNLGIIRTKETMDNVRYPKLPTVHIPEDKRRLMISTFRATNFAATTMQTTFWYISTKQVDEKLCALLFEADNTKFSVEGNLCMSYFHLGGAYNCEADKGAPLSIRYNDEDILVGLNLHKHECGGPKDVAAFVCIKTNKDWIDKIIKR